MNKKFLRFLRVFAIFMLAISLVLVGQPGSQKALAATPYVVLDPGHGGTDAGAPSTALANLCGISTNVHEKDITLDVALKVKDLLQARGIRVSLTRSTDVFVDINPRSAYINQEKPNLAVSIHTNSGGIKPDGTYSCGDGVEGLYSSIGPNWAGPNPNLEASKQLAFRLASKIHDSFGLRMRDNGTGILDTAGNIGVVRDPTVPSALIEMAYVSNTTELNLMQTRANDFAQAIASAILDQLGIASMQKLDLVFVIDTTSSMWDDIAAAKASAVDRINGIDSQRTDYRIALVDYRDFPVLPYGGSGDYSAKTELAFTTDKAAAVNAINGLTLGWGADWKESVYTALRHAILDPSIGGWRDGADKRVILMGDAPPHDPEPFTNYTNSSVVSAANSVDPAVIYTIATGGDPTTQEAFREIAIATKGKMFTATTAEDVSKALEEAINAAVTPDPSTDTIPPEIFILPGEAQNYTQGTSLDFIAADEGGSGLAATNATFDGKQVIGAVLLNTPGKHTFSVSATDVAGNQSTKTISLNVFKFTWRPPLGKGPFALAVNDTLPVKFAVLDQKESLVVDTSLLLSVYDDGASQVLGPFVYNFKNPNLYVDQQNKQYIHTLHLADMGLTAGNYHILVIFNSPYLIGNNLISFQVTP